MSFVYYVVVILVFIFAFLAEQCGKWVYDKAKYEINEFDTYNAYLKSGVYRPAFLFTMLIGIVLVFVAGFRYRVGTDFMAYYLDWTGGLDTFIQEFQNYDEPGMTLVATVARAIYDSGASTIFLAAFITITLYMIQINKYSPAFTLSCMLYIFLGEWQGCFNGVRQYLAAAIIFAGHRFILDKKLCKYMIVVFIASLFHTTALFMIIPYFLLNRKLNYKQMVVLVVGSLILMYSYEFIYSIIASYKDRELTMNSYYTNSVNNLRVLVAFAPIPTYYFLCDKENLSNVENFYFNGMFLNAFLMIGTMNSTYIARIGIYSQIFCIIGYGYLFRRIAHRKQRILIQTIAVVCFFIYWWYSIVHSTSLSNFHWVFENQQYRF